MATWKIDPAHSSVKFTIKHMMIAKVHGTFDKFSGELTYDAKQPDASRIDVSIDAASINTSEAKRDEHLRSADFFDAATHPTWTFKSTAVAQRGADALEVKGILSLHGVNREVVLTVDGPTSEMKDPWGNMRIAASATTRVNRKDFGLTWNAALEAGGVLVGEDVAITLDVQFVKQA